jgi:hypothetical protein
MSRGGRPKPARPRAGASLRAGSRRREAEGPKRTNPQRAAFDEVCDLARNIVLGLAGQLDAPHENLAPFLILARPQGPGIAFLSGFEEEEREDYFYRYLPEVVSGEDADAVAVAFPAWSAPPGGLDPEEHPERKEVIVVLAIDSAGHEAILAATVERSDDEAPVIGPLELENEGGNNGPLAAVLKAALSNAHTPEWAGVALNDELL